MAFDETCTAGWLDRVGKTVWATMKVLCKSGLTVIKIGINIDGRPRRCHTRTTTNNIKKQLKALIFFGSIRLLLLFLVPVWVTFTLSFRGDLFLGVSWPSL